MALESSDRVINPAKYGLVGRLYSLAKDVLSGCRRNTEDVVFCQANASVSQNQEPQKIPLLCKNTNAAKKHNRLM